MSAEQAQAVLEHLENANLFLLPPDAERAWYRYHHLFSVLLLAHLQQSAGLRGVASLRSGFAGFGAPVAGRRTRRQ